MDDGNWTAFDNNLMAFLPKGGKYDYVHAYISIQYDLVNGSLKSIRSYCRMWSWTRWEVTRFLESIILAKVSPNSSQSLAKNLPALSIKIKDISEEIRQTLAKVSPKCSQSLATTIRKNRKNRILPVEKAPRPISDNNEQQIVLWWSVAYEKMMERPYQIAWKRDMDAAKKLMAVTKGNKKDAIIAGCQLLNADKETKTLTCLCNGYWNRRPQASDDMALEFIRQGIFPPMGITLKAWLTEKINGANNQQ